MTQRVPELIAERFSRAFPLDVFPADEQRP